VKNRHDEIDLLAVTFNQMLDRIRNLVTGVRRMNDDIAHDLRSPLTRMRGLAEVTLTQEAREEAYTHLAASTIEECDRLLAMISTMLTISRTEDGVTAVERRPVDVSELVLKACDLFQTSAEDKNIVLSARVEERIVVNGDQSMLQRMVANLIDNAIRYTDPEGCIDVSLNTAEENQAILAVTDTGIGITLEDQALVFERFYRGDRSRSQEGAGLGLSLARAVARAHGGDIGLYSTPGQGSTFTVRLPSMRGTDQP
jgi:signal transduction histidine kinase